MQLVALAVTFGDEQADRIACGDWSATTKRSIDERRQAIRILAERQGRRTRRTCCCTLVNDEPTCAATPSAAWPRSTTTQIPAAILLDVYAELHARRAPRRPRHALQPRRLMPIALLDAVAAGKVPANHLTADLVTNLRNLNDDALNKRIEQVWGIVRTSPAEKAKLIDDYKTPRLACPSRQPPAPSPTSNSAGPSLPKPASNATRSSAPAAKSAPTSPARSGPTSTTCSPTSSTPAPSWPRSISPRRPHGRRPHRHRHPQGRNRRRHLAANAERAGRRLQGRHRRIASSATSR